MGTFSKEVKKELSMINNLSNKNIVKSELLGYLLTMDSNKFNTENEYNINRFSKLLTNCKIDEFEIQMQGNKFCITINNIEKIKEIIKDNEKNKLENIEQIKSVIRGSFLGAGSINDPKNKYHLEIVFQNKKNANQIRELLTNFDINSKILKREKTYILYIKDGEDISKFLATIKANKAVLEFEKTRVVRDLRNNVNRIVNCETANLNKVVQTSVRQIENIKLIKKKHKFNNLTEKEKELANLRLKNPNATLTELGKMLKKPIGKSGVNHRMKSISELAEELKDK